jgi:hypothetical protein
VLAEITSAPKDSFSIILVQFFFLGASTKPIYYSAHAGNRHQGTEGLGEEGTAT